MQLKLYEILSLSFNTQMSHNSHTEDCSYNKNYKTQTNGQWGPNAGHIFLYSTSHSATDGLQIFKQLAENMDPLVQARLQEAKLSE